MNNVEVIDYYNTLPLTESGSVQAVKADGIYFAPEVALVVANRNRDWDFRATLRLLNSLERSDFPREYILLSPISGNVVGRLTGLYVALIPPTVKYILLSDNDCAVPPLWWGQVLELLKDPKKKGVIIQNHYIDRFAVFRKDFLIAYALKEPTIYALESAFKEQLAILNVDLVHDKNVA